MKKQTIKMIMLCVCIIAGNYSCETDFIENNETEVINYGYIKINQYNVDDTGFKTPEGDIIMKTDFKNNTKKKLGVFVIEDGKITQSNIPISYTNGLWRGKLMITKENAKVYTYYPYRTDFFDILATEQLDTAAESAETFFTGYLKNKEIATSYVDADVCVGAGTLDNGTLSFMFNHCLSMVELAPKEGLLKVGYYLKSDPDYEWGNKEQEMYISGVKLEDGTNFMQKNGRYYYFFKPGSGVGELAVSYKLNEIPDEITINASGLDAGCAISKIVGPDNTDQTIAHELKAGDFFMSDGSLKPFDATLSDEDKMNCIGIVFQTDVSRIGVGEKAALSSKGVTTPHALVMALKEGEYTAWQTCTRPNETNESHIDDVKNITSLYEDIEGYAHNKGIWEKDNVDQYPAFATARDYEVYAKVPPLPENKTTEWFMPSTGQWWDILKGLGKFTGFDDLKAANPNAGNNPKIEDAAIVEATLINLNEQLLKVGVPYIKEFKVQDNTQFNTSNEGGHDNTKGMTTINMVFQPKYSKLMFYQDGKDSKRNVRCILAF